MYKVVFDNGKPYEVKVKSETELIKVLTEFWINEVKDQDFNGDVFVFDNQDNDISENQFITEIIGDIMGGD